MPESDNQPDNTNADPNNSDMQSNQSIDLEGIKKEGKAEAEREYQAKLAKLANYLGFNSLDELLSVDKDEPTKPKPKEFQPSQDKSNEQGRRARKRPSQSSGEPKDLQALIEENARLLEERKRLNRAQARSSRDMTALKRALSAKEVEANLKLAAVASGVTDIEYALYLAKKHLQGKSKDDLARFNEIDFFRSALKKSHPYLYAAKEDLSTTGISDPEAKSGTPDNPTNNAASNAASKADARNMSKVDFRKALQELGLTDPSLGMIS